MLLDLTYCWELSDKISWRYLIYAELNRIHQVNNWQGQGCPQNNCINFFSGVPNKLVIRLVLLTLAQFLLTLRVPLLPHSGTAAVSPSSQTVAQIPGFLLRLGRK